MLFRSIDVTLGDGSDLRGGISNIVDKAVAAAGGFTSSTSIILTKATLAGGIRTFPTPDHRAILGSSLAAYGAIDLAVSAPSVFGLCASIAPPTQTASVVANQPAARAAVVSIKFFVMGGVYDSMIDGARLLRTTLDEYSAPVTYLEVSEGHNTNTFRGHLGDALKALLPQ